MACAFPDFYNVYPPSGPTWPVNQWFMGAFTTDPDAAQQLFTVRIPIRWLHLNLSILANTQVHTIVPLINTNSICIDITPRHNNTLYYSMSSPKHLQVLSWGGHMYQDVSCTVLLTVETNCGYSTAVSWKEFKSGCVMAGGQSVSCSHGTQVTIWPHSVWVQPC